MALLIFIFDGGNELKKKLVLFDGNSITFRAFYALPLLSSSSGFFTNAVYGFTMMLLKVLEEMKPSHVLVAFDAGRKTFRHQHYKEYKARRSQTPPELAEQFPLIKEVLDAFQIRHFELNSFEADDIIGTITSLPETSDMEILIVTGDKDMFQLVNERVKVLLTRKGVTDIEVYDVQAILDRYALQPSQMIDLKGLMGDPSDNIPGIPGVGEKTALKMLYQFPSVEKILKNIEKLPGNKLREKVREYQEQALLSKRLATIFKEVPLGFGIDHLLRGSANQQKVIEVFKQLEFKTLLQRTQGTLDNPIHDETEISFEIATEENRKKIIEWILAQEQLALFVETTEKNPHRSDLIGLVISNGKDHFYLSVDTVLQWKECQFWLKSPKHYKIVYDMKKTKIALERRGFEIAGFQFDVLLAAYLLDPSESQIDLSGMMKLYLSRFFPSDDEVYGKGVKRRPLVGRALAEYVARKSFAVYQLYGVLYGKLKEINVSTVMFDLEMPLAEILANMEKQGVQIDIHCLEELGIELRKSMDRLTEEIYELSGTRFNINSPKQLGCILFDQLGLPVIKKTKTGYSTDADVLEKLSSQHEIAEKILHFRQVGKLLSTYVEGLKKELGDDGKIHTQFNQTITATGRLSSTEPNLQNIPIRLEEGRRIRQAFIPAKEGWFMLSADYSQIELRVLAHLSGDKNLQRAFKEEKDIHTQTAMDVFGVKEEEVTLLMRRQAKAVNFGIVYGISDFGLSQNLNIPRKEAKEFIARYFKTYPDVKKYMDYVKEMAKKQGYVTTLLQRRRYLPDIHSGNFNLRSMAERMAMNTPIQGTAADIIKYAMIHVDRKIKQETLNSRMLLQVHDELIFEVPEEELDQMKDVIKNEMENALSLSVPLKVEISVGKNWYEAK
jgi:DNA polymerase-1